MLGIADQLDEWFYCLTCARVWPAKAWDELDGGCPSDPEHPEIHPHVRWSRVESMLGVEAPTAGHSYPLPIPRNRSLILAAEAPGRR